MHRHRHYRAFVGSYHSDRTPFLRAFHLISRQDFRWCHCVRVTTIRWRNWIFFGWTVTVIKRNPISFFSLWAENFGLHTVIGAIECVASDKSSENIPALLRTSCLRLTISQMWSSAVPLASKYRQMTGDFWPIRCARASHCASVWNDIRIWCGSIEEDNWSNANITHAWIPVQFGKNDQCCGR